MTFGNGTNGEEGLEYWNGGFQVFRPWPVLIEAIKEQQLMIKELKEKAKLLENEISELKRK